MKPRWRELTRAPRRFLTAGGALTLIVMLLLVLGGLLDGLYLGSTRALEAQSARVRVLARAANSIIRSRSTERRAARSRRSRASVGVPG